jgi:hypothetical protein
MPSQASGLESLFAHSVHALPKHPTQRVASYVPPVSGNSARLRGFSSAYLTDIEEMRDVTRTKEAIRTRRSLSAAGTFSSDKF